MLLDASDFGSEDDVVGGGSRLGAGIFHVAINHCAEEAAKSSGNPGISVEFVALHEGLVGYKTEKNAKGQVVGIKGGQPTENQVGRTVSKFFSFVGKDQDATDFCQKCVVRFGLAARVLNPGEKKEPNWGEAIGRELIIELEPSTFKDRKSGAERSGSDLSALGFWSLGNAAVAAVPKDMTTPGMQQLQKSGSLITPPASKADTANGNGNGAAAATAQRQTAAAGTTTRSKFADL